MVRLISKLNIIVHNKDAAFVSSWGITIVIVREKKYKKRHLKQVIHFNVDFVKSPGYRHAGHLSYYK